MSIGSIFGGGGGSSDSNAFEIKRRSLEEDRERELARIEKRHREQLTQAEESRSQALQEILEHQNSEVEDQRHAADSRIARAKADADDRIRSFEDESRRMSDEARRQFQSKADQLTKTAQDLGQQREFMLKQHNDQLNKLREEREQARAQGNARLEREINASYQQKLATREQLELKAAAELDELERDIQDRKLRTTAEGDSKIKNLEATRDHTLAELEHEMAYQKRTSASQLEHDRVSLEGQRARQVEGFENQMSEITRKTQREVSQAMVKGRDNVQKTREQYNTELEELRKNYNRQLRELEAQQSTRVSHFENDAKLQDDLVTRGLKDKQRKLSNEDQGLLAAHAEKTEKLREKLNTQYRAQAKALAEERDRQVKGQESQITGELLYQRAKGKRQLDSIARANAETLAAHALRQADPFYRLHEISGDLYQGSNEFLIQIDVPEHEQDTLRVTHQAGALTISGTRRAETVTKSDDGGKASTHSYQSYTQSFPITGVPVMNKMTREYADGRLTIRIPRA